MYGGSVGGHLVEKFNGVRESEIRIAGAESGERRKAGVAFDANTVFDEDGGGASAVKQRKVAAIGQKCDLAGGGVVHAGDAGDFGVGIAFEAAGKFLCDFREFHGEAPRESDERVSHKEAEGGNDVTG